MNRFIVQRLDENDEQTTDAVVLNRQAYTSEKRAIQEAEADAVELWDFVHTGERFPGLDWDEDTGVLRITDDFQVAYTIVPIELVDG